MRKKRILFVISSLRFGGAERQTVELINNLDVSIFAIFLCCLKREDDLKEDLDTGQVSELIWLDKKRRFDIKTLVGLKKVVAHVQPEIVACVDPYPALYIHLLRFFYHGRFRLVQILHATIMPNLFNDIIVRVLYSPLIDRCDQVIFVCKNQMRYWIKKYGIKKELCRVIYNGVDTQYFGCQPFFDERRELRRKLDIEETEIVVCICAALRSEKRHVDLVDAVKICLENGLLMKILIIGDGPERDNIQRHIKRQHMDSAVIITGFQHDVRPFIALSDMFVICSVAVETFSMAILEAMALGKAIVASDIGGASEQVNHGENGFLFPPGNIKALARSLERMATKNLFEPMGSVSRSLVREKFTVDLMVQQYENLLLQ